MQDQDYKAYFFSTIDRTEGSPAPDWKAVLESLPSRGMGINPKPGEIQPQNAPHYGITVMIDAGQNARGRIWLPSDESVMAGGNEWYTHEIQVIANGPTPGSIVWAWEDKGGAPLRPFTGSPVTPDPQKPDPPKPQPGSSYAQVGEALAALVSALVKAETVALADTVQRHGQEIAALQGGAGAGATLPTKIALKGSDGRYVCADRGKYDTPLLANRQARGEWETFELEPVD